MGSSGGHRKLPGGSDDFSLQTNTHCIIIYTSSWVGWDVTALLLVSTVTVLIIRHMMIVFGYVPGLQGDSVCGIFPSLKRTMSRVELILFNNEFLASPVIELLC